MLLALAVATFVLVGVLYAVDNRVYTVTASVAYVLHVVVAIVALRYLPYDWDIWTYHRTALDLLAGRTTGESPPTVAFGWLQAGLYTLFGTAVLVVAVFNALLAVLVALPVAVLARSLYPTLEDPDGVRTLVLALPVSLLFLSLPMRDTLALALFVTGLAVLARALTDRLRTAILAAPIVAPLAVIRIELAGLLVVGSLLAGVVLAVERYANRTVSIPSLIVGVGAAGLLGWVPFSMRYDLATLNRQLGIRGVGGAVYLPEFRYESWIDVFLAAPIRSLYFQFAPFPLHVDGAFDFIAVMTLPLIVALAVGAIHSLWTHEWVTPLGALVGLCYVGGVVGYGLVDTNFGTTVRHRIPFVVLLVVFAAPMIERWWNRLLEACRSLREHVGPTGLSPSVAPCQSGHESGDDTETPERGRLGGPAPQRHHTTDD